MLDIYERLLIDINDEKRQVDGHLETIDKTTLVVGTAVTGSGLLFTAQVLAGAVTASLVGPLALLAGGVVTLSVGGWARWRMRSKSNGKQCDIDFCKLLVSKLRS